MQFFLELVLPGQLLAYTITQMAKKPTKCPEDIIAQECVAVRIRMLNRVVTNIYDDALRPLRLKASQLNILVITAKLGVANAAAVCHRLQLDVSTLSRNVDRMRANGWVEVVASDDGRAQPFRLSADGRRLLEQALPLWGNAQKKVQILLGEETLKTIDTAARQLATESSRD